MRGAPSHLRADLRGVDFNDLVEMRTGVGMQTAPVGDGNVPLDTRRRERAALAVIDGLVIHRNQPGAGTGLDGHVADGHPSFHAQRADGGATELDGVARAAGRADLADEGQHDVFAAATRRQGAFDLDQHVLRFTGQQRLGGQHMLDLTGADAMRQRAERPVRRGVAVATNDGHARQGRTLFRSHHMDDALTLVVHLELRDAQPITVLVQGVDLEFGDRIGDALAAVGGGHVVVADRQIGAQPPNFATRQIQAFKRLCAGHLVNQMAVDVEHGRAVVLGVDDMLVPELVVKRSCCGHFSFQSFESMNRQNVEQRWASAPGAAPPNNNRAPPNFHPA